MSRHLQKALDAVRYPAIEVGPLLVFRHDRGVTIAWRRVVLAELPLPQWRRR